MDKQYLFISFRYFSVPIIMSFFLALVMATLSAVVRIHRGRLIDQQTGLESLKSTPWKQFEHLVAEAFHRQGYVVDCSMDTGPDGGVDVVLLKARRKTLVQCKCWKQYTVGVKVVREMFGILHDQKADEAMVVTTGNFSPDAIAFARGKPIKLIAGPELWQMVREVQAGKASPRGAPPSLPAKALHGVAIGANPPICPECAGPMVRRTAKRGENAGNQFWGCETFPVCKGIRN
jgi:restriction system protein